MPVHKSGFVLGVRKRKSKRTRALLLKHLKSVPCEDCGLVFPPEAMDFDHRPGEVKVDNCSKIRNLRALAEEIAKCDVVCACCHRIRTQKRREALAQ